MTTITVDRFDLALLNELQKDGHITNSALGQKVHLSTSQVSRRVQRLEEAHVIERYTAVLDAAVVGLGVTAFTHVTLDRQGEKRGLAFEREIETMSEVLECFSVTGEADYILRIVAPDLASFSEFMMTKLVRLAGVTNVKSNITLKKIKQSHVLPLDHVMQPKQSKQKIRFSHS
ncbi:Lrp/AsnC family transcriptional regulator [Herbaspirillum sp. RTI4]|uniref:Lrp/AsnC family transcriptional regulator n=1 Tax=Herbaspirillum sp. RTI4 TaxID=3048640 RepID=UPI002AB41451|nr:Lrp/AsnC family transcriptional regulator [Herbaspirillum sp. RTI4]MDY7578436.1 Lrp/AsnC family transcriptional regulator [Herbaspirillum sp. RTI4]MEA9982550.1 Lrp/AsnC family transcriptional regulator [Herbaspirillum sp. RTI4]